MDEITAQRLAQAYEERREELRLEWAGYSRAHAVGMLKPGADPVHIRHALFEAYVLGKLAELQVLAQEQTIRAKQPAKETA